MIESEESLRTAAAALSQMGVKHLRGGAFKLRTLPYTFAGLEEEGLEIHARVAREYGMLAVSEIVAAEQAPLFDEHIDVVQIGARSMRNGYLLSRVAEVGKPVILKRDMSATLREWLGAAEYLLYHGVSSLTLCERGIRWSDPEFRNVVDLGTVAWIKEYLGVPVLVDPSHGCGRADLIERLALASVAAGADGLMIEVHADPATALCDADQALTPEVVQRIWTRAIAVADAVSSPAVPVG